jgi:hypothetical protein
MFVRDQEGNISKITMIAGSLPAGYEEVTVPEELQSERPEFLEAIEIAAVEYVAPVEAVEGVDPTPEYWIKDGEDDVFVDPEDETWTHVPATPGVEAVEAVEEVLAVPAYWTAQKKADAEDIKAKETVHTAVKAAIDFGSQLLVDFATENVLLGITADGMTKTVRQNMSEIILALQTGSLYDAIDEIDSFPVENKDAKYITDARLQEYRDKITNFLGI